MFRNFKNYQLKETLAHSFRKYSADFFVNDKVGSAVHWSGVSVNKNQLVSPVIIKETGCRINRKAGAAHYEHICPGYGICRLIHNVSVKAFFIKNHVGLNRAAAGAGGNAGRFNDKVYVIEFAALHAVIAKHASVKFVNGFAARQLMQTVDVLGNNSLKLAPALKFRQFQVGRIGLGFGIILSL